MSIVSRPKIIFISDESAYFKIVLKIDYPQIGIPKYDFCSARMWLFIRVFIKHTYPGHYDFIFKTTSGKFDQFSSQTDYFIWVTKFSIT